LYRAQLDTRAINQTGGKVTPRTHSQEAFAMARVSSCARLYNIGPVSQIEWRPTPRKSDPTDLTDEEWSEIQSLVPIPKSGKGKRGRPALDRRVLVNAIVYVVRPGCAWRLLPGDFRPWQTVYG